MSIREMNKYSQDNNERLGRLLDDLSAIATQLAGPDPEGPIDDTAEGASIIQCSTLLSDARYNNNDTSSQLDRLTYLIEKVRGGLGVEGLKVASEKTAVDLSRGHQRGNGW